LNLCTILLSEGTNPLNYSNILKHLPHISE
jgi:hypothetical protein